MHDMRKPIRLRRKWVRCSGGSASSRWIWSRSASSLSFLRASSWALRVTRGFLGLFKGLLQQRQHGQVAGASGRLLTSDDISQRGDVEAGIFKPHWRGALAQTFEGGDAVDHGHEIELQAIGVAGDAKQAAHRVVWPQNDRVEAGGNGLQLLQVGGSFSEQKIDVYCGDGCALQRGGRIADQDSFQAMALEQLRDASQHGRGIHGQGLPAHGITMVGWEVGWEAARVRPWRT